MQFKENVISKIISGEKTQTRRLVKSYDYFIIDQMGNEPPTKIVKTENAKTKWAVGKDYAVQTKRGGKELWWCEGCDDFTVGQTDIIKQYGDMGSCNKCHEEIRFYQPLCIKITDIRKEKVRDISEADAKAEGFKDDGDKIFDLTARGNFWKGFCKIYDKRYPHDFLTYYEDEEHNKQWNPEVWALTFEVNK